MSPWSPTWSPKIPVEAPFWMQWWFWTIVAVVIVALAGAVYFLKKRKPPTPTAPPLPTEGTSQNIHRAYGCYSFIRRAYYVEKRRVCLRNLVIVMLHILTSLNLYTLNKSRL